jgi:hypothetical protein
LRRKPQKKAKKLYFVGSAKKINLYIPSITVPLCGKRKRGRLVSGVSQALLGTVENAEKITKKAQL